MVLSKSRISISSKRGGGGEGDREWKLQGGET
jgi:hypothetical protein